MRYCRRLPRSLCILYPRGAPNQTTLSRTPWPLTVGWYNYSCLQNVCLSFLKSAIALPSYHWCGNLPSERLWSYTILRTRVIWSAIFFFYFGIYAIHACCSIGVELFFKFFHMISFVMFMSSKRIRLLKLVSRVGIEDVSSTAETLAKWLLTISAFSNSSNTRLPSLSKKLLILSLHFVLLPTYFQNCLAFCLIWDAILFL